jgi:hypothetical protein
MKNKEIPLESDILREVCEYLTDEGYLFWRCNNIPVFGLNNAGKMTFRSLPKYTPRGLPDIIIVHKGYIIAVEIKRKGAKLRVEQESFKNSLHAHGGIYLVIHSQSEMDLQIKNRI